MTNSEIQRHKPPKTTQFQPGVCPNVRGRGAARTKDKMQMLNEELYAIVSYRENGKIRRTTKIEFFFKKLFEKAMRGNVSAASEILKWRRQNVPVGGRDTVIFAGGMADEFDEPGIPNSAICKEDDTDTLPDPFGKP